MITIPLQAIPNQYFSIRLNDQLYEFTFKTTKNVTAVTIVRGGTVLVENSRCVPSVPLIPYAYLEDGNFVILTANDDYPFYTEFGITQTLVYATQEEIEVIRAAAN